jgi:CubicO group peptidase (beta-lactamase class C family)
MSGFTRRQFTRAALAVAAAPVARLRAAGRLASTLDDVLSSGIQRRQIPAVVAMLASGTGVLYQGAFGRRDATSSEPVRIDSIFEIASMTKPITSVAAMQLVEQGKLSLDEPASRYLQDFATLPVLDGFDKNGRPLLHRVRTAVTLRQLLSHTGGFAYTTWSPEMIQYEAAGGNSETTYLFEPGTRWQYGFSTDWVGRIIEKVSGLTLEQYFQRNLTWPLGMTDTDFTIPAAKYERLSSRFARLSEGPAKGTIAEISRKLPGIPKAFSGGGGLYGTAPDFVRFMQMILRKGGKTLRPASVDQMSSNQIGELSAGKLKSARPDAASDTDLHPGFIDKFGLGFLINTVDLAGGRSAGSLAWAGIDNTFFWIDPHRELCATVMMQFLPFCDSEAVGLLSEFEKAIYQNT